jgi:hypothetical protein
MVFKGLYVGISNMQNINELVKKIKKYCQDDYLLIAHINASDSL